MKAQFLDVLLAVLEQDGARHASGAEVSLQHFGELLGLASDNRCRTRDDRFVGPWFTSKIVPRLEHGHQARVGHEVLSGPRLRPEARQRAVGEVGVLPLEREETPLSLARVETERVHDASPNRDVLVPEQIEHLCGKQERIELVRIHARSVILANRVTPFRSEPARKLGELEDAVQAVVLLDPGFGAMILRLAPHDASDVV